jgi:rubrerythrin
MPGSIPYVVQLLGRATRNKGGQYPQDQRNLARMRFFVPCDEEDGNKAAAMHKGSSKTLLMCGFLANAQATYELRTLRQLIEGANTAMQTLQPPAADEMTEQYPYFDEVYRAQAVQAIAHAKASLEEMGANPTIGRIHEWVQNMYPDLNDSVLKAVMAEEKVVEGEVGRSAARNLVNRAIADRIREGRPTKQAILEAFDEVLNQFVDETISGSERTQHYANRVHSLTNRSIREYARELSATQPLTGEWLRERVRAYYAQHGQAPSANSRAKIPESSGDTWQMVARAMAHKERGWTMPCYRSFDEFVRTVLGPGTFRQAVNRFLNESSSAERADRQLFASLLQVVLRDAGDQAILGQCGDLPADRISSQLVSTWLDFVLNGSDDHLLSCRVQHRVDVLRQWLRYEIGAENVFEDPASRDFKRSMTRALKGQTVAISPGTDVNVSVSDQRHRLSLSTRSRYLGVIEASPLKRQKPAGAMPLYPADDGQFVTVVRLPYSVVETGLARAVSLRGHKHPDLDEGWQRADGADQLLAEIPVAWVSHASCSGGNDERMPVDLTLPSLSHRKRPEVVMNRL